MTYPGGKSGSGVYQTIINQIPPHELYIEPFFGGGGVFKNIRRALSSIVIDIDAAVLDAAAGEPGVTTISGDALEFLETHKFSGAEVVFADPPYVMESRKSQRPIYKREWDTADHKHFLSIVKQLPCNVLVCGYHSDLYAHELANWRCITYQAQTRSGMATEYLWMNYSEPTALHDYRYLGENFRERERISRKAKRWAKNFTDMDDLEANAVLAKMLERDAGRIATINDAGIGHRHIQRVQLLKKPCRASSPFRAMPAASGNIARSGEPSETVFDKKGE